MPTKLASLSIQLLFTFKVPESSTFLQLTTGRYVAAIAHFLVPTSAVVTSLSLWQSTKTKARYWRKSLLGLLVPEGWLPWWWSGGTRWEVAEATSDRWHLDPQTGSKESTLKMGSLGCSAPTPEKLLLARLLTSSPPQTVTNWGPCIQVPETRGDIVIETISVFCPAVVELRIGWRVRQGKAQCCFFPIQLRRDSFRLPTK